MRYDRILEDLLNRDDFLVVGRSVVRTDALDKVLGRAKFTRALAQNPEIFPRLPSPTRRES